MSYAGLREAYLRAHSGRGPAVVAQGNGVKVFSGGNVDDGKVRTYGHTISNYLTPGFDENMGFTQSSSAAWYTPSNSDINASMKWWLSGVDLSISVPPQVGFSGAGSGVLWQPGQVNNKSAEDLNWPDNITLSAFVIYDGYFTDQADILVGSTWTHVQGS